MPYEWMIRDDSPTGAPAPSHAPDPIAELHLWPYRSLPRKGFVITILIAAGFVTLPLIAVLGSPVLWGLLPFVILAVSGLWLGLSRSYRDGEVIEVFRLWRDRVELTRNDPRRKTRQWQANPHWVRVILHRSGGPVPNYLTMTGGEREVEIGAFLSEAERITLRDELERTFRSLRP